jgi:hypothetical protein
VPRRIEKPPGHGAPQVGEPMRGGHSEELRLPRVGVEEAMQGVHFLYVTPEGGHQDHLEQPRGQNNLGPSGLRKWHLGPRLHHLPLPCCSRRALRCQPPPLRLLCLCGSLAPGRFFPLLKDHFAARGSFGEEVGFRTRAPAALAPRRQVPSHPCEGIHRRASLQVVTSGVKPPGRLRIRAGFRE